MGRNCSVALFQPVVFRDPKSHDTVPSGRGQKGEEEAARTGKVFPRQGGLDLGKGFVSKLSG